MNTVIDLEAQQVSLAPPHATSGAVSLSLITSDVVIVREEDPGRAEAHEMDNLTSSVASPLRPVLMSPGQDVNNETQSVSSLALIGPDSNVNTPIASIRTFDIPSFDPQPCNATFDSKSEEPRMIGDFDGSANEFWKLYRDEAKSHDDSRISTLKDGMDSALIFAGLFSAVLTAFVVDSKQNLKPSPADQTVYYLQQHSAILSQISIQLSSITPQVPIPSTPPPPFPPFSPMTSDIRVNVFWFMALTFSLLAALLAILVQQWVRNYMHVFQRYGDPLKSSRLRQYLYEGCERWNMPVVADAVPGFLHVSLFLFFAGLVDSLLNINKRVALSAIVPIGIFGLLYIFTIVAPIIYPQSPYQNLFSSILWYLMQKSRGRKFKDHRDGETKSVSENMSLGQMQLAMEYTVARQDRDVRATRWLIGNLTGDAEMEKFLSAIPGSFNTEWGTAVWKRVGEDKEGEDNGQDEPVVGPCRDITAHRHPPTHATTPDVQKHSTTVQLQGKNVVYELSTRVARSVEICKNRGLFASDDLWRRRARACIEATASLVFCADAKIAWFGGISKLLGDISSVEKIRKLSSAGMDEMFVMRWTCLSLVAIRKLLEDNENTQVQYWANAAINQFASLDGTGNDDALAAVRKIDETLKKASGCLIRLYRGLLNTKGLTEEVKEIVRGLESDISELEQLKIEREPLRWADVQISGMQTTFNDNSNQIISQIPGVLDEFDFDCQAPIPFGHFVELTDDPRALQFLRPGQTLKSMCSPALTLRNILQGQGDADACEELQKSIGHFHPSTAWQGYEMERQLWRFQDLADGGGLGFTVELFFIALLQLSSKSSSKESHSALYTGTFRVITSDWNKYKDSVGTQKLLLDIAISRRIEFGSRYPAYIVDEFLSLLGNFFEGQTGPHIDRAKQQIDSEGLYDRTGFMNRVLRVLTPEESRSSHLELGYLESELGDLGAPSAGV